MLSHRRPDAPPPPKPVNGADPTAPTTSEWRDQERLKATQRRFWLKCAAAVLTLPLVAGGLYAFPLAYLWRVLCVRVPPARLYGVAWAIPAVAVAYLFPGPVFGPTLDLALLVPAGMEAPVLAVVPIPGLGMEVSVADPFPPLRGHLTAGWAPGLVLAGLLCGGWGVGGLLEGAKLKPRSAREVMRAAERAVRRKPAEIERGMALRVYITMFFAKQGTGKTEYVCWLVTKHPGVRFYWLSEQTDVTLAPYLDRWGLADAPNLHVVTRDKADELWRKHQHQTGATWDYLGPMALEDAGRHRADVFIMDTWTAWSGSQDKDGIQRDMAPIREAVGRHRFAAFVCGHTNKDGVLLGSKEFERLCDISVGGEVVEGTEVRRLWWVKDRSPNKYPTGTSVHLVRDLSGAVPCYREATPEELSSGGVGGAVQEKRDSNTSTDRVFRALEAGPATVAELRVATDLSQPAVSLALTTLEVGGRAARIGKKGRADLWRVAGTEDDDGPAVVAAAVAG